jgi:hypothetical protein
MEREFECGNTLKVKGYFGAAHLLDTDFWYGFTRKKSPGLYELGRSKDSPPLYLHFVYERVWKTENFRILSIKSRVLTNMTRDCRILLAKGFQVTRLLCETNRKRFWIGQLQSKQLYVSSLLHGAIFTVL